MVPYGNTKKDANGVFTCQHGVDECTSDVYEQCVLYKLSGNITSISTGDTSMQAFPFLQCMELNEGAPSAAQPCFQKTLATTQTAVTWATIDTCSQNEANAVQNEAAIATPAHDYVPWVLVDNKVLDNSNLLTRAICNAYTGPQPASCKVVTTVNEGVRSRSYNDN
jgi:interferon gamma-inducible protein 30